MNETLPIEVLLDRVRARFTAQGIAAENVFGWREPAQHARGDRVAWVPGDQSGSMGTVTGGKRGMRPRSLATLNELFTVWISAADPANIESEAAQYHAARVLYDAWYEALYKAAHGTFTIKTEQWLTGRSERRYGAACKVVIELQAAIPERSATDTAPVDTAANITVNLVDEVSAVVDVIASGNVTTGEPTAPTGTTSSGEIVYAAGEPLSALRVVRFASDNAARVVYARPPETEALGAIGITANAAASVGNPVRVVLDGGELEDPSWLWIPGKPVLLDALGTLTQSQPSIPYLLAIGMAVTPYKVIVRIEPPIYTAA